jgi:2-methylfumaryl-CoA isomerase
VLPAWDCICGQMAALGLMAAERHRRATGEGQHVKIALKDVAAAMLGNLGIVGEVAVNGVDRPKVGNALYGAFGQDFPTADGRRVMAIGLTGRQWSGLVKATGTGEEMEALGRRLGRDLAQEGERWAARKEIGEILAPWFAARRVPEIAEALDANGVTWSVFRSFAEALAEDPDLSTDNPMFAEIDQPGIGPLLTPGSPLDFTALARQTPAPAPELGAHTDQILAEVMGLPDREIGKLHDQGIVAGPR